MEYILHPIFVHFPIALLLLYSVIKILPLSKYFPKFAWKHVEIVLLITGVMGAFVAIVTGEDAKELLQINSELVNKHELFANISIWIYVAILLGETLSFINPKLILNENLQKLTPYTLFIEKVLTNNILSKILALCGLVSISITGMLGGILVYGLSADPLAPIVLRLLGIEIR